MVLPLVVGRTFCDTGSVPLPRNGPPPTLCSLESCLLAWKHQALFLLVPTTRSHPGHLGPFPEMVAFLLYTQLSTIR